MSPRTKAVVAVHLFGNIAPVAEIEALGVPVLEDAAQAAGTTYASGRSGGRVLGTAATWSFFPSKNLGAFGDGGAITTTIPRSPSARRCCASTAPTTRRPSSTSATTRAWTSCRRRSCACCCPSWTAGPTAAAPPGATTRSAGLADLAALPVRTDGADPAWHLYVIKHERADELAAALKDAGIGQKAYYRVPIHLQPAMREYAPRVDLPATTEVARTHLAIPMSAGARRRAGRRGDRRRARVRGRRRLAARARPHRPGQPPPVRQGRRRLARAARPPRGGAGPHRPALRRRAVGDLRARAGRAQAGDPARAGRRLQHRADGQADRRAGPAGGRAAARRRARLRRHELDADRRHRRRAGGHPGRPRRGGHALVGLGRCPRSRTGC